LVFYIIKRFELERDEEVQNCDKNRSFHILLKKPLS